MMNEEDFLEIAWALRNERPRNDNSAELSQWKADVQAIAHVLSQRTSEFFDEEAFCSMCEDPK